MPNPLRIHLLHIILYHIIPYDTTLNETHALINHFSAGTVLRRQDLTFYNRRQILTSKVDPLTEIITHNIGIQMKQKELTKTFRIISNWKNPVIFMVYAEILSVVRAKFCMNPSIINLKLTLLRKLPTLRWIFLWKPWRPKCFFSIWNHHNCLS